MGIIGSGTAETLFSNIKIINMKKDKTISFLLLDHNRPEESRLCLESIKKHCSEIKYKIYFLANGNDENYAQKFFEEGLIDHLIQNKKNNGCGFGTMQLFQTCDTEYAFYVQVDQFMISDLLPRDIEDFCRALEGGKVGHIDVAGDQGNGSFSERALFTSVSFYNAISKEGGGPGPYCHLKWSEESVQDYYRDNEIHFLTTDLIFQNNGKWSQRENPDGSKWRHRTDSKELWMISPPSIKYDYPKFSDEEWKEVLKTQSWEDGKIPKSELEHSFKCFN
jgi:hypothetical protein